MSKFGIKLYLITFLFLLGMYYWGFGFEIGHSLILSLMVVLIIDMIKKIWFWDDEDE